MKKIIPKKQLLCFQWALCHSYKFVSLIMMRKAEQVACKIQIYKVCKILLGEPQGKRILRKMTIGKYTRSSTESVVNKYVIL
jgi:hypothetical protein